MHHVKPHNKLYFWDWQSDYCVELDRNLIFWGIIELWIVALGVPVVQEVVVHQVPTPALREENVSSQHSTREVLQNACGRMVVEDDCLKWRTWSSEPRRATYPWHMLGASLVAIPKRKRIYIQQNTMRQTKNIAFCCKLNSRGKYLPQTSMSCYHSCCKIILIILMKVDD